MQFYVLFGLCVLLIFTSADGQWDNPDLALERSDELQDAEIYRAVYSSIKEWERKKKFKDKNGRFKREESTVCYADLGCFEASGPFSYLEMLPSTPEEISTKFVLYPSHRKRRSGQIPAEVPFKNLTEAFDWAEKGFNSSLQTKVMIHGFGSDCTHVWVYEMRSALMAVEDVNIICVDWANGAILPNYVKAAANTRLVGKQLSMLLKGLIENNGLSAEKLHLIGFSLGAHVAGFAGAELGNLSRITGLDPAGPLFESQDPRARLDQTDADFVDVIHSNGENLILGGLGSWQPMGHVDFYPNGGRMQKGCSNLFVGAFTDIIWSSPVEGRSLCNHRRAYKFFTDSVSPRCHFPAFPCNSYEDFIEGNCFPCNDNTQCGNMGYYADRSKGRGQLYLITRDEEPFCAHQYLIKIESSPSNTPITSYGKLQVTLIGDSLLNETFTLTRKDDDEMKLGTTISRIVVPHPILLEPAMIQINYIAYSGWLSSGLSQWKIDKITLSDSYGKSHSVCKKNLILESGKPVILPLYPGECNLPKESVVEADLLKEAEDRKEDLMKHLNATGPSFVPTPVVKIGVEVIKEPTKLDSNKKAFNIQDAIDIFNLPWTGDKDNRLDEEVESSRAFNTRVVVVPSKDSAENKSEVIREIMEPILKPQSSKHGRAHNPDKGHEISEPILAPNTNRIPTVRTKEDKKNYNILDVEKDNKWIPTASLSSEKWKREDDAKTPPSTTRHNVSHYDEKGGEKDNGFHAIVKTVQFLPQRLARMFEEAEKYARETILPLVSTYTPRFISDFITPPEKKYVPLDFQPENNNNNKKLKQELTTTTTTTVKTTMLPKSEEVHKTVEENLKKWETTIEVEPTSFTNIQKIPISNTKRVSVIYPEAAPLIKAESKRSFKETSYNPKIIPLNDNNKHEREEVKIDKEKTPTATAVVKTLNDKSVEFDVNEKTTLSSVGRSTRSEGSLDNNESTSRSAKRREIYINLPVFEDPFPSIKYIPLSEEQEKRN